MKSDALERFAMLFKERENPVMAGVIIGEVISPPPNFRVKIYDEVIIEKDQLILGSQWDIDYERTFEIFSGEEDAEFTSGKVKLNKTGETFNEVAEGPCTVSVPTATPIPPATVASGVIAIIDPMHDHDLKNDKFSAKGTIKWKNTFKIGDELIIIPAVNLEVFYVLDKAVRF